MQNSPINIVFIGNFTYPVGKAGTQRVKRVVEAMTNRGSACLVMLFSRKYFMLDCEGNYSAQNRIEIKTTFIGRLRTLVELKAKNKRNVLYVYNGISVQNFLTTISARVLGYQVLVDIVEDYSLHTENVSLFQGIKIGSIGFFESIWNSLNVKVIAISRYLELKYKAKGYKVLYLPIMANDHKPESAGRAEKYICYAGGYGHKDGAHVLVKAYNKLNGSVNYTLKMTGYKKDFDANYPEFDSSKVQFLGFLNEVNYALLIQQSSLLVVPRVDSEYANAGFPFKLGEFLSTSRPVIVSDISNVNEYIEHRVSGLVTKPGDTDDLLENLKWAIEHEKEAKEIGLRGYEVWRLNFNPEIAIRNLVAFIHE